MDTRARAKPPLLLCTVAVSLAASLTGCVTVKPVVVDRKTELENQILGTFERLQSEMILASSVRGAGATEAGPDLSPLQREALDAMLDREFNRDDIDALKAQQAVGEGKDGLLVLLAPPAEPQAAERTRALVERENRDRQLIMQRVIQLNRDLGPRDLPLVRQLFYRLSAQAARPGDQVQQPDGRWTTVQQPPAGAAAKPPVKPPVKP